MTCTTSRCTEDTESRVPRSFWEGATQRSALLAGCTWQEITQLVLEALELPPENGLRNSHLLVPKRKDLAFP